MSFAPPRVVASGDADWMEVPASTPALDIPAVTVTVRIGEDTDVRVLSESDSEMLLSSRTAIRLGQVLPALSAAHLAVIVQHKYCGVVVGECTVEVGEAGDDLEPGSAFLKFVDRDSGDIYAIRAIQESITELVQFAKEVLASAALAQLTLSVQEARKQAGEV